MDFVDATDVDLLGVMNTVAVDPAPPARRRLDHHHRLDRGHDQGHQRQPDDGPGGAGYGWSKRVLIDYVEQLALQVAPRMIRVNAMHPTNVNTHLLQNDGIYSVFRPD